MSVGLTFVFFKLLQRVLLKVHRVDLCFSCQRVDDYGLQTLLDDRLAPRSMHMNSDNGRSGIVDIPWSPPAPNWNPWTASKIDRGYYVTVLFIFKH